METIPLHQCPICRFDYLPRSIFQCDQCQECCCVNDIHYSFQTAMATCRRCTPEHFINFPLQT